MIKGLYETQLYVENIERSIDFYSNVLGMQQCHFEPERRVAFFWIGNPKEAMKGRPELGVISYEDWLNCAETE